MMIRETSLEVLHIGNVSLRHRMIHRSIIMTVSLMNDVKGQSQHGRLKLPMRLSSR